MLLRKPLVTKEITASWRCSVFLNFSRSQAFKLWASFVFSFSSSKWASYTSCLKTVELLKKDGSTEKRWSLDPSLLGKSVGMFSHCRNCAAINMTKYVLETVDALWFIYIAYASQATEPISSVSVASVEEMAYGNIADKSYAFSLTTPRGIVKLAAESEEVRKFQFSVFLRLRSMADSWELGVNSPSPRAKGEGRTSQGNVNAKGQAKGQFGTGAAANQRGILFED